MHFVVAQAVHIKTAAFVEHLNKCVEETQYLFAGCVGIEFS